MSLPLYLFCACFFVTHLLASDVDNHVVDNMEAHGSSYSTNMHNMIPVIEDRIMAAVMLSASSMVMKTKDYASFIKRIPFSEFDELRGDDFWMKIPPTSLVLPSLKESIRVLVKEIHGEKKASCLLKKECNCTFEFSRYYELADFISYYASNQIKNNSRSKSDSFILSWMIISFLLGNIDAAYKISALTDCVVLKLWCGYAVKSLHEDMMRGSQAKEKWSAKDVCFCIDNLEFGCLEKKQRYLLMENDRVEMPMNRGSYFVYKRRKQFSEDFQCSRCQNDVVVPVIDRESLLDSQLNDEVELLVGNEFDSEVLKEGGGDASTTGSFDKAIESGVKSQKKKKIKKRRKKSGKSKKNISGNLCEKQSSFLFLKKPFFKDLLASLSQIDCSDTDKSFFLAALHVTGSVGVEYIGDSFQYICNEFFPSNFSVPKKETRYGHVSKEILYRTNAVYRMLYGNSSKISDKGFFQVNGKCVFLSIDNIRKIWVSSFDFETIQKRYGNYADAQAAIEGSDVYHEIVDKHRGTLETVSDSYANQLKSEIAECFDIIRESDKEKRLLPVLLSSKELIIKWNEIKGEYPGHSISEYEFELLVLYSLLFNRDLFFLAGEDKFIKINICYSEADRILYINKKEFFELYESYFDTGKVCRLYFKNKKGFLYVDLLWKKHYPELEPNMLSNGGRRANCIVDTVAELALAMVNLASLGQDTESDDQIAFDSHSTKSDAL